MKDLEPSFIDKGIAIYFILRFFSRRAPSERHIKSTPGQEIETNLVCPSKSSAQVDRPIGRRKLVELSQTVPVAGDHQISASFQINVSSPDRAVIL